MLDTGSNRTNVRTGRDIPHDDKRCDDTSVSGAGGGATGRICKLPVKVGDLGLDTEVIFTELNGLPKEADGILGFDFLSHYVVEIDHAHSSISFYDAREYSHGGPAIPLSHLTRPLLPVATVHVKSGPRESDIKLLIDTGYDGLEFSSEVANGFEPSSLQSTDSHGLGGDYHVDVVNIRALTLGSVTLGGGPATKATFKYPEFTSGRLGMNYLKDFVITIDYSRYQMWLDAAVTNVGQ